MCILLFQYLVVHLFINRSFSYLFIIRSFTSLFIRCLSFTCIIVSSFVHLFTCLFVYYSFISLLVYLFIINFLANNLTLLIIFILHVINEDSSALHIDCHRQVING